MKNDVTKWPLQIVKIMHSINKSLFIFCILILCWICQARVYRHRTQVRRHQYEDEEDQGRQQYEDEVDLGRILKRLVSDRRRYDTDRSMSHRNHRHKNVKVTSLPSRPKHIKGSKLVKITVSEVANKTDAGDTPPARNDTITAHDALESGFIRLQTTKDGAVGSVNEDSLTNTQVTNTHKTTQPTGENQPTTSRVGDIRPTEGNHPATNLKDVRTTEGNQQATSRRVDVQPIEGNQPATSPRVDAQPTEGNQPSTSPRVNTQPTEGNQPVTSHGEDVQSTKGNHPATTDGVQVTSGPASVTPSPGFESSRMSSDKEGSAQDAFENVLSKKIIHELVVEIMSLTSTPTASHTTSTTTKPSTSTKTKPTTPTKTKPTTPSTTKPTTSTKTSPITRHKTSTRTATTTLPATSSTKATTKLTVQTFTKKPWLIVNPTPAKLYKKMVHRSSYPVPVEESTKSTEEPTKPIVNPVHGVPSYVKDQGIWMGIGVGVLLSMFVLILGCCIFMTVRQYLRQRGVKLAGLDLLREGEPLRLNLSKTGNDRTSSYVVSISKSKNEADWSSEEEVFNVTADRDSMSPIPSKTSTPVSTPVKQKRKVP